ncbi:MAG: Calx-beta domain-containing protein, partial [Planctomycetota bacterium]
SEATVVRFPVTIDGEVGELVTVQYETIAGAASAEDGDFQATSGTLTWTVDDTGPRFIDVVVNGDLEFESDENFGVRLTNAINSVVVDAVGEAVIVNDEALSLNLPSNGVSDATLTYDDDNSVTIAVNGEFFDLQRGVTLTSIDVTGVDGRDNKLTIDIDTASPRRDLVSFDGGTGDSMDTVQWRGGSFAEIAVNMQDDGAGGADFILEEGDEAIRSQWNDVERAEVAFSTAGRVLIKFHAGVSSVEITDAEPSDPFQPVSDRVLISSPLGDFAPLVLSTSVDELNLRGSFSAADVTVSVANPDFANAIKIGKTELLTGDFDFNGSVDGQDLEVWEAEFGRTGPTLAADADENQHVDGFDFLAWQRAFGDVATSDEASVAALDAVVRTAQARSHVGGSARDLSAIDAALADLSSSGEASLEVVPRESDAPMTYRTALPTARTEYQPSPRSSLLVDGGNRAVEDAQVDTEGELGPRFGERLLPPVDRTA